MFNGEDLVQFKKEHVPEEFWKDFDAISSLLNTNLTNFIGSIKYLSEQYASLSDKELGLVLPTVKNDFARFIFPYRKSPDLLANKSARSAIFMAIRPVSNVLNGYVPSIKLLDSLDV
jgi:RNA ligase